MENFDFVIVFDVFIGILGIYLIFAALKMHKTGEISTALLSSDDINKCRDKNGFAAYMYLKTLVFGIVSAVFGIVMSINDGVRSLGKGIDIAGLLIFLAVWIWFVCCLRKGRKEFFYS